MIYLNKMQSTLAGLGKRLISLDTVLSSPSIRNVNFFIKSESARSNIVRVPASLIIFTMPYYVSQVRIFGNVGKRSLVRNQEILCKLMALVMAV